MAGLIADDTIQRIRERLDIVEVISSYLPLKRSGGNYQGLCPFHGEKTPSFNVNPARQIFHCFGCGVGGNALTFVMRMEGLSFPETVKRLGERVGIEVAEEETPEQQQRRDRQAQLLRVAAAATEYYRKQLLESPQGEIGRRYLKERGYGRETAERFRLGYAADARDGLAVYLEGQGMALRDAEELGLVRAPQDGRSRFDLLRQRLVFPIEDERGRVVAFGGRILGDGQPKYLNSPESLLYHKGQVLYGLYQARDAMRRSSEAIVVEGYFDLLALHRAGFTQAAATCGTAMTSDQARLLKRHAQRVLLLFDQDSAGQKAAFRAMEVLLSEGVSPLIVNLAAGEDPDSFLRKEGKAALEERLAAARPALELFMEATLARHGNDFSGRARAAEEVVARVKLLPSELERNLYLKSLARQTGIDEGLLLRGQRPAPATPATPSARVTAAPLPARTRRAQELSVVLHAQDLLLLLLLSDESWHAAVTAAGVAQLFPESERAAIATAILQQGPQADPAGLCDALGEGAKAILSAILIKDEKSLGEDPEKLFADCCRIVRQEGLKARKNELQAALGQPDVLADADRHDRLLREYQQVSRDLKGLK